MINRATKAFAVMELTICWLFIVAFVEKLVWAVTDCGNLM